jgi:Na+/H+ antiporter NhaD/arsenite permease-like protein
MECFVFGLTLLGVALFHQRALTVALAGFVVMAFVRVVGVPGGINAGAYEIIVHLANEWVPLANLFLVLLGFAVLANQFERSNLPEAIPSRLPDGWLGGVALLAFVFGLSAFLDNIAASIIGGVIARHVYPKGVTIGFMAAIVAAANAGGAGSVIGDTTTTMMWIRGVSPLQLAPAFIGAIAAFAIFAPLATFQQQRLSPISRSVASNVQIDWPRVLIVLTILITVVAVNVVGNSLFPGLEKTVPALGLGLWIAILATAPFRAPQWRVLIEATRGATFLVVLVALASLIPVDQLPTPSPVSVFGLGLLSAVFDNIPLTALALNQGGYDWALLAYAVGFGGSMVWFGSSAGVALTNLFPEGRSVLQWLRQGWSIPVAYIVGFLVMLAAMGWRSQTL